MNSRKFLITVTIATVLLFVIAVVVLFITKKEMPPAVWALIPLYGIVTFLLYQMLCNASKKSPARFVASVNGSVLIKLFMSALIVGVYFYLGLPGKKALALAVMGIYAVYTSVLIRALLPVLRNPNKSDK